MATTASAFATEQVLGSICLGVLAGHSMDLNKQNCNHFEGCPIWTVRIVSAVSHLELSIVAFCGSVGVLASSKLGMML